MSIKKKEEEFPNSKYDKDGINKKTYELLFKDEDNIREMDFDEKKRCYLLYIIEKYTRFREKSIFSTLLKLYYGSKTKFDFSKIKFNETTGEYEFEEFGEKLTFNKLSNLIENKELRGKLESEKRYGECHVASMGLATVSKDFDVLTGYENIAGGRYLHSVIETPYGKIIDFTKNLVMSKEDYIKLTGFTVLERITNDELYRIHIKIIGLNMNSKVLATFGSEILKDIEKNPSIFKEDEKIKKLIIDTKMRDEKQNEERD